MARYVVIGAGAVGTALAAELTLAGIDNVVAARGEQYEFLSRNPLRYLKPEGEQSVGLRVVGGVGDVALTPADVLVLTVKAQQALPALQEWAFAGIAGGGLASEVIPIVTVQNGLSTEGEAARLFDHVLGASIWTPASYQVVGTTAVHSVGAAGLLWLGVYPEGVSAAAHSIACDLARAQFPTQVVDDIARWKRAKLLSNLGNAVDVFAATDETRAAVERLVRAEAAEVFQALCLDVADYAAESILDITTFSLGEIAGYDRARRSTWQSLQRGAGSAETDYLNGEVVVAGKAAGVPTPLNAAITRAVRRLVVQRAKPGSETLDDVLRAAQVKVDV